jgi:N-acyl amino acid synthase of PEP-CTERM/exosortase system
LISEKRTFDNLFEVYLADTPASKKIHFQLRYQVYCEEIGFEDKALFSNGMEHDEWDAGHAVHFLVRHKLSGAWLGGLRLVYSRNGHLPFEGLVQPHDVITNSERTVSVEMSRLCIVKEARRFSSREFAPYDLPETEVSATGDNVRVLYNFKNHTRSLMWGLFRAAVDYSREQKLEHWYFLVAPALASCVRREGFKMVQIADACEYRGTRIAFRESVEDILNNPIWLSDYKNGYTRCSDMIANRKGWRRTA